MKALTDGVIYWKIALWDVIGKSNESRSVGGISGWLLLKNRRYTHHGLAPGT